MGKISKSIKSELKEQKTVAPKEQRPSAQLMDNRAENTVQMKLQGLANSRKVQAPIQREVMDEDDIQLKGIGVEEIQMVKIGDDEVQLKQIDDDELQMKSIFEDEEIQMRSLDLDSKNPFARNIEINPIQRAANKTGLPDQLKSGVENLSGYNLDDVQVHYNSDKPKKLNAHAYAQGSEIHIASGQEKHLPHEAWHVVQQKQGRVNPTRQMKGKVNVNDDAGLEREADVMGDKAVQLGTKTKPLILQEKEISGMNTQLIIQKVEKEERPVYDEKVAELIQQVKAIVSALGEKGKNWESKYREKGKEKSEDKAKELLSGEKQETNYPKEILKKIWGELTPEEKYAVAKAVGGALLDVVKQSPSLSLPSLDFDLSYGSSSSSGSKKEKKQESKKEKKKESQSSGGSSAGIGSVLSELTLEDAERAYEVYKQYGRLKRKIEEVKGKVVETSGKAGGEAGAFFGSLRDQMDFNKQCEDQKRAFLMARKRFEALEPQVKGDRRYQTQIDALEFALMNVINGPGKVYLGFEQSWNESYSEVCKTTLDYLESSEGVVEKISAAVGGFFSRKGGEKEPVSSNKLTKPETLPAAQALMLSKLTTVTNKSWSSKTYFFSTPKGISQIKSLISKGGEPHAILAKVQAKAQSFGSLESSSNRSAETQILYEALAKVKLNEINSVWAALSKLDDVHGMI